MKKSLLATTALAAIGAAAVASPASAQWNMTVGGYMEQWFGYGESNDDAGTGLENREGFDQKSDGEIHFKPEITLDNGIKFGANVQLEAQTDSDQIDEQYAYIDGSFGRILLGSENAASYIMHYSLPSFGATLNSGDAADWISGIEFTMARTNGRGIDNDSEKVTYFTPRFYGFQLGASYVPEIAQDADDAPDSGDTQRDDSFSIGLNFQRSFNDFKFEASAGYQDFGDTDDNATITGDLESYVFGLRLGFAGFTVAGTYGVEDRAGSSFGAQHRTLLGVANTQSFVAEQETFGLGAAYAAGPFGVSLNYIRAEFDEGIDADQDVFELGAMYKLGPGVEARASFYYGENEFNGADYADGFGIVGGIKLGF